MSGFGFYDKYTMLRGNLRDKPDATTPADMQKNKKQGEMLCSG